MMNAEQISTSMINCPASMRPTERRCSESSIRFLEVIEILSLRGLIIGRKLKAAPYLLARWIVRSVPLEIGSSGHEVREKPGLEQPERPRREDRRIVRQALVDPTVTHSTIRVDEGVAIVPQTISDTLQMQILNPSALSVRTPFNTGALID
ncbi:hypothetical protein TNCV_1751701 [Trichonephila clavipes]|nr:hypothetical protein TNCV_1751701 [Trichonephila clavipes]